MTWVLAVIVLTMGLNGLAHAHPDHSDDASFEAAEFSVAEAVLSEFLEMLNAGDFEGAVKVYSGSYERLESWNPAADHSDLVQLLEYGCRRNGLQCLKLGRVIERSKRGGNRFVFKVELANDDGTPYERPPCCGESGPPTKFFELEVRKVDGQYFVYTLPPYQA